MRTLTIVMSVLVLVACSQKDPGDDKAGVKGDAGPDGSLADDYYPMVAGSTLVYRHTGGSTWDDETKVTDTEWNGEDAYLTQGAPDPKGETSKNVIIRQGNRLLRAHKEELRSGTSQGTVDYEPGFLRFDSTWVDADEGFSVNVTYKRIEKTASGNVSAEDEREHTFTVESLQDPVSVPAGTFEDCMRVRRVRVRGNASNAADDDDKVFWFCAGIGKVKELSEIGGGSEELVSCEIPGGSCP